MTTFHYRAMQDDGTVVEGDLQVEVQQEAYRQMECHGLRLINLSARPPAETALQEVGAGADRRRAS